MFLGRISFGITLAIVLVCSRHQVARAEEDPKAAGGKTSVPPMTVAPGFVVEPAALAPLVEHPMMAGFDDRGRLYIAESAGKNLESAELEKELPNFIRRLEDLDGDGKFDKSTIFADKMTYPMGALWHEGSLYVASPPSIWKLTDDNDDGVADRREEIVGRFGYVGNAADIHGCFLGPEGRIYWCDGRHGHRFTKPDGTVTSEGQAARIFSCRSDGSDVQVHCGGGMDNPVEIDFTPEGEMLGTVNLFYEKRGDCLVHWMHGGVYPRRDQQKVLEEFKRTGDLLGPVIDMGHVAVSGMTRYRSHTFGSEYTGNIFLCEFNTHKIRRLTVTRNGSTFAASAEDFLTVDSIDCHPTDVLEDADGSLLVIDTGGWFRYGCPTSQIAKPSILGAIYRIRKEGAKGPEDPWGREIAWDKLSTTELAKYLADPRFAVAAKAKRGLVHRGDSLLPDVKRILGSSEPAVRGEVAWILAEIGTPAAKSQLREMLLDIEPAVRQVAAHALGTLHDSSAVAKLSQLVTTDEPPVRREAATALGKIGSGVAVAALFDGLRTDSDRVLEHALIYALIEVRDIQATTAGLTASSPVVRRAALLALDQMDPTALTRDMVTPLLDTDDASLQAQTLEVIGERPEWSGEILGLLEQWLGDSTLPADRVAMLRGTILAFAKDPKVQSLVTKSLRQQELPTSTRVILLDAIARSRLRNLPEEWAAPIQTSLASTDPGIAREAVNAASAFRAKELLPSLVQLGEDGTRPTELRTAALAVIARQGEPLDNEAFHFLAERCVETAPPTERMAAADALGSAKLTEEQLVALAKVVERATPIDLPLLYSAVERLKPIPAIVAKPWLSALARSPGLSSLRAPQIDAAFGSLGGTATEESKRLIARLGQQSSDQAEKLEGLAKTLTKGDVEKGKGVFFGKKTACFACHRIGDQGGIIGPDLSTIGKIRVRKDLTEAIVFPSASLARGFQTYTVALTNGEVVSGVLAKEANDAVFLRNAKREELRIERSDIESIVPSSASVMPQGLDQTMTPEELADLLAYLESLD